MMVFVVEIPLDRLFHSVLKRDFGRPTQIEQLFQRDVIASVVEIAILYVTDVLVHFLAQPHCAHQRLGHLDVFVLIVCSDIVDFTQHTLVQDQIERVSHVVHKQERTFVLAGTVNRDGFLLVQQANELRNQLLRELTRPIHIIASGDDERKFERTAIRLHEKLGSSFGGSIRICGTQSRLLSHGYVVVLHRRLTVHLIGGHVNKAFNLVLMDLDRLQQDMGAEDVGLSECKRVSK